MTPSYREANFVPAPIARASSTPLLIAAAMMFVSIAATFVLLFESDAISSHIQRPYLIPWVLATGAVVAAPVYYLKRRGEFSFINPIIFPALLYFFPVFFFGGWSLVFGWSSYHYLNYVTDPEWNFPLAFVYVILGFGGLSLGFLMPIGKRIGHYIGSRLPSWEFTTSELILLNSLMIPVGLYLLISAIGLGTIGYQAATEGPSAREVGSLSLFLTIVLPTSSLFLWIAFFRLREWGLPKLMILMIVIPANLFFALSAGNRGGLFGVLLSFLFGLVLSRRQITTRQWVLLGAAAVLTVFVGMAYGNTFRSQKGTFGRVSTEQYYETAVDTVFSLGEVDISTQFESSVTSLFERMEVASSLAVIVSNYEVLAPYEKGYGLENNIWLSTWASFIPRFLWKDKPAIADNGPYNELYFDSRWSGFAMTAMGDLLRNFGPIGVPLGMLLIGFLLRIFYATLIEGVPFISWKGVLFCIVATRVGYEGFYGQILPDAARAAAIVIVQIVIMRVVILLFKGSRR